MPRPLAAASLCAALLALLLIGVIAGVSQPIDELLMTAAFADSVRGPLSFLRPLTELGSTGVVTVIAVAMLPVGFAVRRIVQGAAAGVTIALASLANTLVKLSVARERPDLVEPVVAAGGYSFPSGHAALSMVAYGIVGVLIARSSLPAGVRVVTIAVLAI
ncbi:MAG TPA: phosphatase PAP2 family protein, partial [Candidatus Limnocylindria bacterium]|nr:phosphatase PAP2 family protein [Candidatus Limnocylindria bacterium]